MQNRSNTRSMLVNQSASRTASQVMRADVRGRASNTLRRAGSALYSELAERLSNSPATTPPSGTSSSLPALSGLQPLGAGGSCAETISSSTSTAILATSCELPSTPPEDSVKSNCGLTPASLKHLRRQNQKLTEEKETLRKDLEGAQAVIRELGEKIAALEAQLRESEDREEKLKHELVEAREGEETQRNRAEEAERLNIRLEESLAAKEAEVARLRQALEEQLQLTKEVCEAAERSSGEARGLADAVEEIARLGEQVKQLEHERDALQKDHERRELEAAALQQRTAAAMAAAEKAIAMHAKHLQHVEALRVAKLADAIQHKVELHISVPRVSLSYNNAPPLLISVASALGDHRIKEFLDVEVFRHFEPLWATLDSIDKAPDGTNKKAYSSRMLERLTEAVKGFVEKSQRSDEESGLTPSVREALHSQDGEKLDTAHDRSGEASKTRPSLGDNSAKKSVASNGSACAMGSLAETDRDRLLSLLRSGDDSAYRENNESMVMVPSL